VLAKRILAVLVAVALVAGAFVVRGARDDAEADDPAGSTTPTIAPATAAGELRCITELRAVCATVGAEHPELTVTVQDAGATLDQLAQLPDDEPRPLWLTIEPYPGMVDELRTGNRRAPFGGTPAPVGASRLVVASTAERAGQLAVGCVDQPLWSCIGANAGDDWTTLDPAAAGGRIRPALGDVERQAVALASFAAAVAGYFATPDIRSSDWQNDPAFTPWFSRLAGAVDVSTLSAVTPLATMGVRPALDIAATTDAELATIDGGRFVANYPEPSMWVQAVVAVPEGTAVPDDVFATVTAAMSQAGWDAAGAATQPLPGPTTMLALRALWQEST
jgi:hypothetical protein